MKSIMLNIHDESKISSLLGVLRDLQYVEVCDPVQSKPDDVYAGIPSKIDEDLQNSQFDVLEKADW